MKKLIYIGMRIIVGNKKRYVYVDYENTAEKMYFKNRLCRIENVGNVVECENEGNIYRNSKVVGILPEDHEVYKMITIWSMEERLALDDYEMTLQAKKPMKGNIDFLIKQIKDNFFALNRFERTKIARYVFEELLK